MKKVFETLKNSEKAKKTFYILVCVFVFLYMFSLPSFSGRSGWNYIPYGLMALLMVVVFLYTFLYSKFEFKWYLLFLPLFCAWALIGTIFYSHQFRDWLTLPLLTITFFVFYYAFKAINDFKRSFLIIMCALLAFCVYFLCIYYEDLLNFADFSSFRLGFYFDNVNAIAGYMSLGFAIALYFLFCSKRNIFYIYLIPLVVFAIIGISTGSRTFLVDILLLVVGALIIRFKDHKVALVISLVCLIVALVVLINLPFLSTMKSRLTAMFSTLFGSGSEGSTTTRILWQIYGVTLSSGNLIIGYGADGFAIASGVGTYTHGNYAEVICDFGIVGFLIYYSFIFFLLHSFFKSKTKESAFLFTTIVVLMMVNGFLGVHYYSKWTFVLFALCCSTLSSNGITNETNDEEDIKEEIPFYEVTL